MTEIHKILSGWLEHDLSLPTSPSDHFRMELAEYAASNFPLSKGFPVHLRQEYITEDPNHLPLFGSAREALSIYFASPESVSIHIRMRERLADRSHSNKIELIQRAIRKCQQICDCHSHSLMRERRKLTQIDPYGNTIVDEWNDGPNGAAYFIDTVLIPSFDPCEWEEVMAAYCELNGGLHFRTELTRMVNEVAITKVNDSMFRDDMSGIEYEDMCEMSLRQCGWMIHRTPATGDQGVDLIATIPGLRVCIQCKRYSSPVGNSAVQEVVAGRFHWKGTHAVLVSNAGYTASAEELALSTEVKLLHHDDLVKLKEILHK